MVVRVAVLVDGDNVGAALAPEIVRAAALHGRVDVIRVYGDMNNGREWQGVRGYRPFHAGTGKNAADLLLAIDAMELALTGGIETFVIASGDGDFVHLAQRLREHGLVVMGLGPPNASLAFRVACSSFTEIERKAEEKPVSQPPRHGAELDRKVCETISTHGAKAAGLSIVELNTRMLKEHEVRIGSYPERTWRAYLQARPKLFDLDPKGPDAKVRRKPS